MSDLVGNPEDRFSHNEAQMVCILSKTLMRRDFYQMYRVLKLEYIVYICKKIHVLSILNESCYEKTGLQGFRPGLTQTGCTASENS